MGAKAPGRAVKGLTLAADSGWILKMKFAIEEDNCLWEKYFSFMKVT